MKSYRIDDSILLKLPKVKPMDPGKEKSCFVDHNRCSYIKYNLGNFDFDALKARYAK